MTTRVFLAVVSYQYEGESVLAVCSSRERALVGFKGRCEDPDRPGRMGCGHDAHFVEEWTIDGACEPHEVFSGAIEDAWASEPRP